MEIALELTSVVVLVAYFLFLFVRIRRNNTTPIKIKNLNIIVPFKNESSRIQILLSDLISEFEGNARVKLLFVDDHSTDNSVDLIEEKLSGKNIRFQILPNLGHGKKNAIQFANQFCELNTFVLTLDADIQLPKGYANRLFNLNVKPGLNVLTIDYVSPKTELQFLVKTEADVQKRLFLGNVISRKPSLCSGAHLLYKAEYFEHLQPYANNMNILSGDDMFLLDATLKEKEQVHSHSFSVQTEYPTSWKHFLNQRQRWMSKSGALKSKYYYRSLFVFMLLQLAPLALFFVDLSYGIYFYALRWTIEWLYLMKVNRAVKPWQLIILPLFSLSQLCLPLLYIFGNKKHGQTW